MLYVWIEKQSQCVQPRLQVWRNKPWGEQLSTCRQKIGGLKHSEMEWWKLQCHIFMSQRAQWVRLHISTWAHWSPLSLQCYIDYFEVEDVENKTSEKDISIQIRSIWLARSFCIKDIKKTKEFSHHEYSVASGCKTIEKNIQHWNKHQQ